MRTDTDRNSEDDAKTYTVDEALSLIGMGILLYIHQLMFISIFIYIQASFSTKYWRLRA